MPITPPQVRVPTTGRGRRLQRVGHDVAAGPAYSSVDRDDRAARRLERVAQRLRLVPGLVPADDCAWRASRPRAARCRRRARPAGPRSGPRRELGVQVPVELGPARRHHVRDVQVAEPPAGALAHRGPLPGDQVVVAQPRARWPAGPRPPAGPRRRAAASARPACRPCRPAARSGRGPGPPAARPPRRSVARRRGDARGRQRGARADHRGLAGQDPRDPPGAVPGGPRSAPSRPCASAGSPPAAGGSTPACEVPSLALQLPQHVVQVIGGADAVEQRPVAVAPSRPSPRRPCRRARSCPASAARSRGTSAATRRGGSTVTRIRSRSTLTASSSGSPAG